MTVIILAVKWICRLLIYAMLGRAILSWFITPYNANPNSFMYKLYALLTQLTEPIIRPFQKWLGRFNTGPIDFSLFLAVIVIGFAERLIIQILYMFL